jgi:hypothetical protein
VAQPLLDPDYEYDEAEQPQPQTSIAVGPDKRLVNHTAGARIIADPDQQPALRPQPKPTYIPPERFQVELLNRRRELSLAGRAVDATQSLEFYGPAGVGKSTLLHYLAARVRSTAFPDGVISLSARPWSLEDLRQILFENFYHSDPPFKPQAEEIQTYLRTKQALIVLDDVSLSLRDLETLQNVAPQSTFLLAAAEHHPWTTWQALVVPELPFSDALRLVERALGRPPTTEEQPAAEAICNLLGGHPLLILQVVSFARAKEISLTAIARQMAETFSVQETTALVLSDLSEAEQRVLGVLAALGGASLAQEHLAGLTGLADPGPTLETLVRRYLISHEQGRFSLMESLQESLAQTLDLHPWFDQTLSYFATWTEQHQDTPDRLLTETDAMLQTLQQAVYAERWPQILYLVRPLENALLLGRRWGAWEKVLRWGLLAARELGDRSAEAWALHQLGTAALCLGEQNRAANNLKEALQLRAQLEDEAGMEVTKHNLSFLEETDGPSPPGPPTPPPSGPPPPPPSQFENQLNERRPTSLPGWLLGLIALLLILLAIVVGIRFFPAARPAATPTQVAAAGPANLQLNVTQLLFSRQPVGQQSPPKNIIVTNAGLETTTVGPISLAGQSPNAFLVGGNCMGAQLKAGTSCTIEVRFVPQTEGGQSAMLLIAGPGGTSLTVQLHGGQMAVISANPSSPNLGPWLINTSTIPQPILLSNSGAIALTIGQLELTGPDAADFAIVVDQCTRVQLMPGQSCQVNVILIPEREGNHSANLVVTTDPEVGPFTVPLSGVGLLATPTFTPTPTPTPTPVGSPTPTPTGFLGVGWVLVPDSLDFGAQQTGTSSGARSVTLTNNGPKPLTVNQVAINGPAARDFTRTADNCAGVTLEAGTSCTIDIVFSPQALGNRQAFLVIGFNAPHNPHPVILRGTGQAGPNELCPEPTTLNFGQQQVNTPSPEKIITLKNCGSAPLTVQHLSLDGDHPGDFSNRGSNFKCEGVTLPINGICTIGYRFRPSAVGPRSAILTIKHTGPNKTQEVRLEGLGVDN